MIRDAAAYLGLSRTPRAQTNRVSVNPLMRAAGDAKYNTSRELKVGLGAASAYEWELQGWAPPFDPSHRVCCQFPVAASGLARCMRMSKCGIVACAKAFTCKGIFCSIKP